MFKKLKKIYYADDHLQLHEVRWFRTKIFGFIAGTVMFCLAVVFIANHVAHDILGFGFDRVNKLSEENKVLVKQLGDVTSKMQTFEGMIGKLNSQGNQLRLMVDLPRMDDEIAGAGIGGAVAEPEFDLGSDNASQTLNASLAVLQKLNGEIKVQEQSYAEIVKKYDYNKAYFSAMPALKPMEGYYSPNGFGLRMHPVLGIFKTHEGLDIIGDVGTPVYASGDGVVEMAGQSGGGYGTVVAINHGYEYQTLYAHLSKVLVHEGQRVRRGDLIAKSGKTGLVSGPHLHYEVRYKGVCRNPVDYFLDDVTAQQFKKSLALQ